MKKVIVLLFLIAVILLAVSCTAADPFPEDIYFGDVYSNGVLLGAGGAEADPVFTGSPAFGITAGDIVGWDALVGSQWVTDANGIEYLGSVGIHTGSSASSLLTLYSSDGISNDAILDVTDNSASAEAVGIHVNITGVKTDYTDGIYISNIATANTAGADKYGLRIKNTGNWLGVGSVNNCLYIETPTGGTANYSIYSEGGANYLAGKLSLGDALDMSQIGAEPASTADRAGIYAIDLSPDNCTIGFNTETAVQVALGVASTNRMPVRWNGATYYLLAEASGFYSPLAGITKPTVEQGLRVGLIFLNTDTHLWEKCTSLTPVTWENLPSGSAAWGSITGTLSAQQDLSEALNGKLSSITGTALDNVFSSNGLLKRTGVGTYTVDESAYITSFTELDPVFGGSVAHGISSGDITNWNGKLSSFTELDPLWVASASYGISTQDIINWNAKLGSYTETDPVVKGLSGIIVSNGTTISSITNSSTNWNTAYSNTHSQNTDTGTTSATFTLNSIAVIKEGDSRLTNTRDPNAHNQSATTITTGTLDGDRLPAISTTKQGAVPLTGTASGKYLKDDGTWATVSATETDPVVKALSGIITSNGSVISAITNSSSNWDAGYTYRLTSASGTAPLSLTLNANGLTGSVDLSSKQTAHANLTSLAALTWTSGSPLIKMTGANTFGLDSTAYLTGNQSITWTASGDISGNASGTTSISPSLTVTGIQNKAITLATGFLKYSGSAWSFDNSTYITGNQSISLGGDASGSGTTSISVTNSGLKGVALPALSTGYLYYSGSAWAFQTPAGGGESETVVVTTSDTANSTTTLSNATGLTFSTTASKTYIIEGFIIFNTSVATVGIKLTATNTNTPTLISGHIITDAVAGTPDSSTFNANNVVTTTSASAYTTGNIAVIHCVVVNSATTGTFQIRFAAETTGTITIKAGSMLRYRQVDFAK